MVLAKSLKVSKLVNIFAREDGRRTGFRDLLQKIREVPGNDIFHPLQVEFFKRFAEPDNRLHAYVAKVIHRQWHFITDVFAHGGDVLAEPINALVGNLGGSEG